MNTQTLDALESELLQSGMHESRVEEALARTKDFLKTCETRLPSRDEVLQHFTARPYSGTDWDVGQASDQDYSFSELEEAFFDCLTLGLTARLWGKPKSESKGHFERARTIATYTGDPFFNAQLEFATKFSNDNLLKKLQSDLCNETFNRTLLKDNKLQEAYSLVATGLELAQSLSDAKRELDFLGKAMFALYEYLNRPHVALSLGHYLLSQTRDYRSLHAWTHFHLGNIYLDLQEYNSAKQAFEEALEWAIASGSAYANMTMYERLGLTCKNLGKLSLAQQFYEDSLTVAELHEIKPWLVANNQVRCLIGLGLLDLERAKRANTGQKADYLATAENNFKQAAAIAKQINALANEAAALSSLGELYALKEGGGSETSKMYHSMAYRIKKDELALDPSSDRVKKDA